ncbi:hypothetical protein [Gordonia phthalatica]|uniref:hypothetical protein n=1 Tax=Gordonia phthalatica TaxID=1136941 RepID=UPI0012FEC883
MSSSAPHAAGFAELLTADDVVDVAFDVEAEVDVDAAVFSTGASEHAVVTKRPATAATARTARPPRARRED